MKLYFKQYISLLCNAVNKIFLYAVGLSALYGLIFLINYMMGGLYNVQNIIIIKSFAVACLICLWLFRTKTINSDNGYRSIKPIVPVGIRIASNTTLFVMYFAILYSVFTVLDYVAYDYSFILAMSYNETLINLLIPTDSIGILGFISLLIVFPIATSCALEFSRGASKNISYYALIIIIGTFISCITDNLVTAATGFALTLVTLIGAISAQSARRRI